MIGRWAKVGTVSYWVIWTVCHRQACNFGTLNEQCDLSVFKLE